ncbi:rhodanese-like domain-containing protein [Myxococcota bacterium]|nr:rhodanese-like domain-containing protein [Myxococcota bacterium]
MDPLILVLVSFATVGLPLWAIWRRQTLRKEATLAAAHADSAALLNEPEALVVDVRTEEEFNRGHLPGAINVPLHTLDAARAETLRGQPVLLVCQSGRRAAIAARQLQAQGVAARPLVGGLTRLLET